MATIDNSEDILDSRDIIKRIEELEEERDNFQEEHDLPDYIPIETTSDPDIEKWTDEQLEKWVEWEESEEGEELKSLIALQDELERYCPDWIYGTTLIRENYFTEYCKELVVEIDALPVKLPSYIENNIDWDGVAEDLKVDYTSADFDGVTYWAR